MRVSTGDLVRVSTGDLVRVSTGDLGDLELNYQIRSSSKLAR